MKKTLFGLALSLSISSFASDFSGMWRGRTFNVDLEYSNSKLIFSQVDNRIEATLVNDEGWTLACDKINDPLQNTEAEALSCSDLEGDKAIIRKVSLNGSESIFMIYEVDGDFLKRVSSEDLLEETVKLHQLHDVSPQMLIANKI